MLDTRKAILSPSRNVFSAAWLDRPVIVLREVGYVMLRSEAKR